MMKEGSKDIKFDWEHTEYTFVMPDELKSYETVPNLAWGLGRCLVGKETEEGLKALRDDHESGAQGMALLALNMLLKAVRGKDLAHVSQTEEFWRELRMIAWHLAKNGRPSMGAAIEAALFRALDTIKNHLENTNPAGAEGIAGLDLHTFKGIAESAIRGRIAVRKHSLEDLGDNFVKLIVYDRGKAGEGSTPPGTTIVTLSSSGTIKQCLVDLIWPLASSGTEVKLSLLESRPKFEGASFVSSLIDALEKSQTGYRKLEDLFKHLKIEIVSDASVSTVVKHAD